MASVNKVIILGNLGQDPECKKTSGGKSVATLSVATSEKWKDKEGNKQEQTQWHRVVLWEGLADIAEKYLGKGSKVYIEGKLVHRSYEKDGEKKYLSEIVCSGFDSKLVMLDGAPQGGGEATETKKSSDLDDEIPF